MKAIYPDRISSVSADTENAEYPASNIQNDMQKKVWKATASTATLTIVVDAYSKAIAIFNTNADSVTISIKTAGDLLIETYTKTLSTYDLRNFWQDYTEQTASHKVVIDFTAPDGEVVEVGAVKTGAVESLYVDPDYGIGESLIDHSFIKQLNNGAADIYPAKGLRTFDGRILIERDDEFYDILRDFVDAMGDQITAFSVASLDYAYWTVLGWFRTLPTGSHDYPNHSVINFQIEEVP